MNGEGWFREYSHMEKCFKVRLEVSDDLKKESLEHRYQQ